MIIFWIVLAALCLGFGLALLLFNPDLDESRYSNVPWDEDE